MGYSPDSSISIESTCRIYVNVPSSSITPVSVRCPSSHSTVVKMYPKSPSEFISFLYETVEYTSPGYSYDGDNSGGCVLEMKETSVTTLAFTATARAPASLTVIEIEFAAPVYRRNAVVPGCIPRIIFVASSPDNIRMTFVSSGTNETCVV
ncbi:hypothetical protein EXVG_00347 [Emiliania huxleyi virus 202]|nr:hypothetical protein EXVG_00347 [Emiliania huxleyi virus 202]